MLAITVKLVSLPLQTEAFLACTDMEGGVFIVSFAGELVALGVQVPLTTHLYIIPFLLNVGPVRFKVLVVALE